MVKRLSTIFVVALLFAVTAKAQWTYEGVWPDTNYRGGTHGIEVTPDGKIWQASYYKEAFVTPGNDTIQCTPLYIFNPDGSLFNKIAIITTGSSIDTLGYNPASGSSGTRSVAKGADGNIYFTHSGPNKIIKINYQTLEGMARHDITEVGSSPIVGGASSDGTVFVGPVVGGGTTAIVMYDGNDLSFLGNAVVGPPNIARYFTVAEDGNTIHWTMFTGGVASGVKVYSRPDEFSEFALTDSLVQGMSIETARINPVTGYLWVSNDKRSWDNDLGKAYTHLTWYAIDLTTKALVDSFTLPEPDPVPSDEYPRGLAFSADGNTAYVGLFGSKYHRIFMFTKSGVGVREDPTALVNEYSLSQNYPNPFNPSTDIKFTVIESGFVTLKVYDVLGREVATLVNEQLSSGGYTATFDASDLTSGTYVYRLTAGNVQITKKMMLLK